MGKPRGFGPYLFPEFIGIGGATRGIETSKYPEERKSNETPLVAASERGIAQTNFSSEGWGCRTNGRGADVRGSGLERPTTGGDSPVPEDVKLDSWHLSTTGHVKSGGNLGGPPSKAKYSMSTDSEPVP